MSDFRFEQANFHPQRAYFKPERTVLGPQRADSGSRRARLELERPEGDVWTYVWMYGETDGRLEIHPCVLQDIGPLRPLLKKCRKPSFSTFRLDHHRRTNAK